MVEVFGLLQDKLDFIRRFYNSAAKTFESDLRKIEVHEEPYDTFDAEDGEPPFLSQWLDDKESLNLLGKACLCLVQSAFKSYLDGFLERSGREGLLEQGAKVNLSNLRKGNWFKRYQRTFLDHFGIDWRSAPSLGLVEEINLARNGIQHGGTFYDLEHRQNDDYHRRFPDSVFADELEKAVGQEDQDERLCDEDGNELEVSFPYRITITRKNLHMAIDELEAFCSYLEKEWERHPA